MGGWKFSNSGDLGGNDGPSSSSSPSAPLDLWVILLLSILLVTLLVRYLRLVVGIVVNLTFKAYPIPAFPSYIPSRDVTVVVPTVYKCPSELASCLSRINACGPNSIFVVLLDSNVAKCQQLCRDHGFSNVTVLGVPVLGKRTQMVRALDHIATSIVVWADDDVFWPAQYLENLLAIFENPKVGAGGTCQRVRRSNGSSCLPTNFWNILGISYLERRVFNNLTTNAVDGSLSTLSGRSSAYRTEILKTEEFRKAFTTDKWGNAVLNSDDDKFLTRYVMSRPCTQGGPCASGWEIAIQRAVFLETTLEESSAFIHQCLRWARARYRGNLTVMRKETYWRSQKYAWGAYVIYFSCFQFAFFTDLFFFKSLDLVLSGFSASSGTRFWWFVAFFSWLLFTKVVKMIPHFLRNPLDLVWLPALIIFGYLHSLLNVYVLFTLNQTAWGGKDLAALSKKGEKSEVAPLLRTEVSATPSSS
jgi:cellulose synthase/poly-beta-1,6-N-acetylglucosamine synthase-like glycosyltransferase